MTSALLSLEFPNLSTCPHHHSPTTTTLPSPRPLLCYSAETDSLIMFWERTFTDYHLSKTECSTNVNKEIRKTLISWPKIQCLALTPWVCAVSSSQVTLESHTPQQITQFPQGLGWFPWVQDDLKGIFSYLHCLFINIIFFSVTGCCWTCWRAAAIEVVHLIFSSKIYIQVTIWELVLQEKQEAFDTETFSSTLMHPQKLWTDTLCPQCPHHTAGGSQSTLKAGNKHKSDFSAATWRLFVVGSFSSVLEHLSGVTSHSQLSSVSSISTARKINLIYNSQVPLFLLLPYQRKLHIRGRKQTTPTLKSSCWVFSSSSSLFSRANPGAVKFSSSASMLCPGFFALVSEPSSFWGLRWVSGGETPRDFWVRDSSIASLYKNDKNNTEPNNGAAAANQAPLLTCRCTLSGDFPFTNIPLTSFRLFICWM